MAPVPLFATSLEPHYDALTRALAGVVPTERFILGPEVQAFEDELAAYLGVGHCVGVANGTDALSIALRALGVAAGDDVVVPSFTFYATAEAVAAIGARPVFCDVEPETFCVTRETVERALTPATKAIVPVHLFGNVAPAPELRELGLPVLEDAAQAIGASLGGTKAGGLGDAAIFSFFPAKNLPGLGDGGAVVTNDDELAERVRRLRFHGSKDKVEFVEVGYNSRLDELQAAALRVLLPELNGWNARRRAAAAAYEREGIAEHAAPPRVVDGADHVYHLYVVRHESPDELASGLVERGVGARGYYRVPVHRQPAMAAFGAGVELPGTDEAARTHLALPMGPLLTEVQVGEVIRVLASLP